MKVLKVALHPKNFVMGSTLLLIPIFNVASVFLVFGYILNCAAHAMGVRKTDPTYYPMGIVLLKGLLGGLVVLGYALPVLLLLALDVCWPALIMSIIVAFILPGALIHFVDTMKVRAAFSVHALKRSLSPYYAVSWLGVVAINAIIYLGWGILAMLSGPTIVIPLVLLSCAIYLSAVTSLVILAQVSKN
jgi:hypothetical protein